MPGHSCLHVPLLALCWRFVLCGDAEVPFCLLRKGQLNRHTRYFCIWSRLKPIGGGEAPNWEERSIPKKDRDTI